ncbi:sulfate adenylyltransferase subunit CysN [Saccharophagus degradans]|uniref:Sulfate adenylyltransferase subunit 1 n=1 Tax=Saccharophagus degradans (strain 2-40 / ATCC 43961 / DSM 17024) TaxID=203122 RepID=CYSN_SACD2|nr:sulfate adenylyltransferase subunit CysN [Saccharophagus degradans]Q21IS6.1 RecName: Full=Sulfate adenylyltransferase subunit 1; AltName: Full=ATP-sulfurylase large subunit; AltName: Full=Sulfate adenylate transferase; Short=SAT [Saccharophagus degradans 2-40]ABD81403.1 sulfate adenylyltransferase subunit 1 [Saccharophagus degradans 2-40]
MSHQSDLIETDIDAYLAQHEQKELLRFLTCGSVDDGKSTLIGRLLHDSKMIYEDQLEAVRNDNSKHGTTGDKVDLALLVDGLQAEREQGITIDVAYRYFSTAKRKFIIADTPGHEQYTRNMATGASTCDMAIILIDARHGVMTQTRRHSFIASLLGIKHLVIAINKMDLVDYSQETFESIKQAYGEVAKTLGQENLYFVPMSALDGDNVVNKSENMPWYTGESLMEILESVQITGAKNLKDFRYPVQYVNRPHLNFRGFCGTVASGEVKVGDEIRVLPSGKTSKVKEIVTYDGNLDKAFIDQAVTITLEDEIDISRGDMLVHAASDVQMSNRFKAHLVWMSETNMAPGKEYLFKFATKVTPGSVAAIDYRVDVNTFEHSSIEKMELNDIAVVELALDQQVVAESYQVNRGTGAFIVIDRLTNITVAAGMVIDVLEESSEAKSDFSAFEVELNALVRKHFPHWDAKDISKLL